MTSSLQFDDAGLDAMGFGLAPKVARQRGAMHIGSH